jgi:hypothetical protein
MFQRQGKNGHEEIDDTDEARALHTHTLWLSRGLSIADMHV